MKYIWLLLLIVSACTPSAVVTEADMAYAISLCEANGGFSRLWKDEATSAMVRGSLNVFCKNGATFRVLPKQPGEN